MNILTSAFMVFNKIKVVHSIPGRVRLFVPGLGKVPEDMRKYQVYTTSLMKMLPGIKEISYSYITSKVLITYDPQISSEKEIIEWINLVWKKVVENRELYENMSQEEIEKNLDRFYTILCEELKKRG